MRRLGRDCVGLTLGLRPHLSQPAACWSGMRYPTAAARQAAPARMISAWSSFSWSMRPSASCNCARSSSERYCSRLAREASASAAAASAADGPYLDRLIRAPARVLPRATRRSGLGRCRRLGDALRRIASPPAIAAAARPPGPAGRPPVPDRGGGEKGLAFRFEQSGSISVS
jgi:hypothetical protein